MKNKKFRGISLLMAMIMAFTIYLPSKYVRADIIETTIPTGSGPWGVAVNSNTNKIYVVNKNDDNVEIIDGDNLNNKCFVNISNLTAVAVNQQTNKIYTTSLGNRLTVIDGTTNAITNIIPVGENPCSIAVDEIRNIIYVANHFGNNVTIIDGNTNNLIATVPVGTCPNGIAVNPNTNKIYVANQDSGNVTVIDGDTKSTTYVNTGAQPSSIAVNPVTNKIYVANGSGYGVTIIDGTTNSINNINVGGDTFAVAVNSGNNKIYLSEGSHGQLDIIDGGTYEITKVPVGNSPYGIALNTQTQNIYVNNYEDNTLTILDGHTYNVAYDANGGTGNGTSDTYNYNVSDKVTVKANTFINDGYYFTGWNTSIDGTGTGYSPGSTFNISSNVKLYAQWKPVPMITWVSPAKGLISGGTNVVITGTGFTGATSVKFGNANATSFTVDSDSQITVQAPPYGEYWLSCFITVTTAYGTGAGKFEYFPPTLISSVSLPNNEIYKVGDNLDFIVNYDYTVAVTGTPLLAMTIGNAKKTASYAGGNGTSNLKFTYTVQPGDNDNDGIELYNTIELNGGTIKGVGDFDAGLTLKNAGSTKGILITNTLIGMSNGDSITAQIPVTRTTDPNGAVNDSVQIGQGAIESAAGASAGTLTVNDPSNNFSVTVLDAAVHSLADRNASIAFGTPLGSVEIPTETIAGLSSGITVQFGEVRDTSALAETRRVIDQCAPGAKQLSTPYKIETNYLGRTQVTIPISTSILPSSHNEFDMNRFLSQLGVFVEHSDGENVLQRGEIKYDSNGLPRAVAIFVDKFSTFTLVELADTTSTTGSANTTETVNSTSGSKTLVQTGAVIDYKLQIASGLIIVLLGVILAIAGKKREDL